MTLPVNNISASLINQELLYSSTRTVSLGSQAVRQLFQRASGSISMQNGQLRQGPARITALVSTGVTSTFSDLELSDCVQDPVTGQIYLVGQQDFNNESGSSDDMRGLLICLSQDGRTLLWARTYRSSTGRYHAIDAVTTDSAGNVYCVCRSVYNFNGSNLLKYNSSGTLLAHASVTNPDSASNTAWLLGVAVDPTSGSIYCSGYGYRNGGGYGGILIKYNADFSVAWQRQYQGYDVSGSKWGEFFQCRVDSSGNVYTVGWTVDSPGYSGYVALLVKWNSAGSVIWERTMRPNAASGSCRQSKIQLDNSGNVYMQGWFESSGYTHSLLTKLDTNGNILWSRKQGRTTTTNGTSYESGLFISSDGQDIYHLAYTFNTIGSWYVTITYRYDNAGNLVYQRHTGNGQISEQMASPVGGFIDRSGNFCVAFKGYKSATDTSRYTIGVFRQRTDITGSLTGTSFQVTHSDSQVKTLPFGYPTANFTLLESASGLIVTTHGGSAVTGAWILGAGNGTSETVSTLTMAYSDT